MTGTVPVSDTTPPASPEAVTIALEPVAAFAALRQLFRGAEYDESTVAHRLGGPTLVGAPRLANGRKTLSGEVTDTNAALVRLFFDGLALPTAVVRDLFGDAGFDACIALHLLTPSPKDDTLVQPTVMLIPLDGLWLTSDMVPTVEDPATVRQDYVFSANNELTAHFLAAIPATPGARVLELCAGTGIAALRAVSKGARSAVAADLIPRCVHFAKFNALLNDMADRIEVVESNAWSAIPTNEPFELVVAHPPYVPALSHRFDFRDAGEDGEHVARAVFSGAATHVPRGGRMIVRAAFSDRTNQTVAERIRVWLGEHAAEFDLVQLEALEYDAMDAYKSVTHGGRDFVDCERWLRHFQSLAIERFVICVIELRRDAFDRPPITVRRVLGKELSPDVADWHLKFARVSAAAGGTAEARLAGQMPRIAAGVRLGVHLDSDADGAWRTTGSVVETDWPSKTVVKALPLMPTLLELCDGAHDLDAILAGLRAAGLVDDDVGRTEVANLVDVLAAAGAVELSVCPLPPRPVRPVPAMIRSPKK